METYNNQTSSSLFNNFSSKPIVLLCLVIITLFTVFGFFQSNKVVSTLSVTGQADMTAKPDSVSFVVTKVNTVSDVSAGIDTGKTDINRLITIVKELGGSDVEIKKTFYQITPQTSGFAIANAFSVKTTKVDNIDSLIKKLYTNGATSVSNVTYESKDINNVEQKLRQLVYKDAKDKALRITKSSNQRLGKVISITDDNTSNTSTIEDLQTNNGLINISKTITIVYQIK
jgi:uncharacterized protein YggE